MLSFAGAKGYRVIVPSLRGYRTTRFFSPDTDLDNLRNRVVGILLGLLVTGFVFNYICPRARISQTGDYKHLASRTSKG